MAKTKAQKDEFKEQMLNMGPCSATDCKEPAEFRDIQNNIAVNVCRKHIKSSL